MTLSRANPLKARHSLHQSALASRTFESVHLCTPSVDYFVTSFSQAYCSHITMKVFVLVFIAVCFVAMVSAQNPLAALSGMGGMAGGGSSSLMTMAALQGMLLYFHFCGFFFYL